LLAEARIALETSQRRGLARAVAAVPASRADDPGLLYDRTRYVRRTGRPEDAMAIASRIVANEAPPMARDDIYAERRLYVARALKAGAYSSALALISNNGLSAGENFADGEFLAGWIQLRFLHDPTSASAHFAHLANNVSAPVSKARALYWQAEAARAQNDSVGADAMLQQAAAYPFTFYGQLAASRASHGAAMMNLPLTTATSDAARVHFESRELVRALRLMTEVGDQHDFESIAFYLDDTLTDPQEIELLSQMARERNYNRTALRSAKAGLFRGVVATSAAYPLMPLPAAISQSGGPEPALVLSIIRQESEFEVSAVSTAHARGLMQLEPSTARRTARGNGMDYDRSSLTSDANYNITLGATHLGSLIGEYNGSYVLAIAAYNAGSFRVSQWIDDWGDPRQPTVDVIDWIELIPFNETRNYVERVMENLEVYRHRLSNAPTPIAIEADLHRGGSWTPPPPGLANSGNALLAPEPAPPAPTTRN
jgi:soluble lytic murein transglycosylase